MLSRLRAFLLRMSGSARVRPADGVVGWALIMIVVTAAYTWMFRNPNVLPLFDRDALATLFAFQIGIALPAWTGFLLAGLLARKRWPGGRLLAHGLMQFYMVCMAFYSYATGYYTNLYGTMVLFVGTAPGLLVFDARIVRPAVISFAVLLVATTVAERMGVLPYAPLFAEPPTYSLLMDGLNFVLLLGVIFLFIAGMERLRRATDVIRRYVPAQLAEKILSGEHAGTASPQRRKVTLFFSDVVGFTDAADRMEAEDLSALLNEYLSEMADIADSFGATVNQFVGDGIMIFFGAPEATTDKDHALRAVRMALAMQRRMGELGEKWFNDGIETPFRIRIGINTGVASVGDFGSEGRTTYSAIGNQTNLAARIQSRCEPGKVLISHTTWALIRDEIPCQERGEIEVKGLHYPVRVYEVVEEASPGSGNA